MGSDFIERIKHSFKKTLDRARVDLGTATLLTKTTSCAGRMAVAEITDGEYLRVGEQVTVEIDAQQLVARRGTTEVARFTTPPPDPFEAVGKSSGIALGTVEVVHEIAGVAEISLCWPTRIPSRGLMGPVQAMCGAFGTKPATIHRVLGVKSARISCFAGVCRSARHCSTAPGSAAAILPSATKSAERTPLDLSTEFERSAAT